MIGEFRVILVIVLSSAFSPVAILSSNLRVDNLKCEYLKNPIAVNTLKPRFSWTVSGVVSQSAYAIEVASDSLKLANGHADLWRSGKEKSDNQQLIEYKGKPLSYRQQCYWRVRVWDEKKKRSEWSEIAHFGVGIIDGNEMCGKYIALDTANSVDARSPILFKDVYVDNIAGNVYCYINSLGYHELYVNGEKVGDDVLAPAVSQLGKRSLICAYDISKYLVKGNNRVAIWLGEGWYKKTTFGAEYDGPVVKAEIGACTPKGYRQICSTDQTWQGVESGYHDTGTWMALQFAGESVDGRKGGTDYNATIANAKPLPVTEVNVARHKVSPQMCEPNKIQKESSAICVTRDESGAWVADMGRVLTGWFSIELAGMPRGHKVTFEYYDNIGENGNFEPAGMSDEYICSGALKETFCNKFNYHAYRYVKILGLDKMPAASSMRALQIYGDFADASQFSCSDADINAIHDMIKYTMKCLTYSGYMVDCPHLERTGYGGDGNSSTMALQTMFDVAPTYANWLQAWGDVMREGGSLPHVAPNPGAGGGGPYWCGFIVLAPWRTYLNYGDVRMLATYYPYMKEWMKYVESYTVGGLLRRWPDTKYRDWYLGDWLAPIGVDAGNQQSVDLVSNCLVSECLQVMSKIASILGHDDESTKWLQRREQLNKRMDDEFFDSAENVYSTGSQLDMSYAMLMGLADDRYEAVKEKMIALTHERYDDRLAGGLVGVPIITEWLIKNHEPDLMYKMLKQRGYPGYLYMIDNRATATWEYWSGERSHVHNCYNGVANWFYQALGGILLDEDKQAYKHVIINPQMPDGIDWVQVQKNTAHGTISVGWKKWAQGAQYEVSLPTNVTATLHLPKGYRCVSHDMKNDVIELISGKTIMKFEKM